MFLIDKRSAADWVAVLNDVNTQFVRDMRADKRIEVANFAAELAFILLRTFHDVANDDQEATACVEDAAHGMSHAIVQTLLHQTPPSFDPPDHTVN